MSVKREFIKAIVGRATANKLIYDSPILVDEDLQPLVDLLEQLSGQRMVEEVKDFIDSWNIGGGPGLANEEPEVLASSLYDLFIN